MNTKHKTNYRPTLSCDDIRRGNFKAITTAFDPKTMSQDELHGACGKLAPQFPGSETARTSPELRDYFRALGKVWSPGHAAFFSQLDSGFFQHYAQAQIPRLSIVDHDCYYQLSAHRDDVEKFCRAARDGIEILGRRAGLSASQIEERKADLAAELVCLFLLPHVK